jgi:iron complex outermembrane receptor protein
MTTTQHQAGRPHLFLTLFGASTAVLAAALPSPMAFAQSGASDSVGLENIVVTARRTEESLQKTPVSVTALSRDDLTVRSSFDLDSIDNFAPNITVQSAPLSSGANFIASAFIRGIGQGDFLATTDPGVGIYVDDVYLARAQGALLDLSDIQRVEVLRGPQGTLFGKNAIGGVIQAVSVAPNDEFGGYGEVSFGRFNRLRVRGDINIPINDELFLRVAASVRQSDGFGVRRDILTNEVTGEQGTEDRIGGRARLRWNPSERFDATLSFDYARVREESAVNDITAVNDANGLLGFYNAFVADPIPYTSQAILTDSPYETFNGSTDRDDNNADMDNWGLSLVLQWTIDDLFVKSITAYRNLEVVFGRDGDGGPQEMVDNLGVLDQWQFSQEFQVGGSALNERVTWLAGAYYLTEDVSDLTDVVVASGIFDALEALPGAVVPLVPGTVCPGGPADPCAGGAGNPLNVGFDNDFFGRSDLENKSYALFLTATTKILDNLSLTTGIRWTHEDKSQVIPFYRRNVSMVDVVTPGTSFEEEFNAVTPKVSLEYQVTPDHLVYFSAARGFRSGGFEGRPTLGFNVGPFGQEFLWSYELGTKTEWFDNRLRVNASVFQSDWSDIQTTVIVTNGITIAPRTDNAGDGRIRGFELEVLAAPTPELRIDASVGYLDAEYLSLGDAVEVAIDNRFPQTPEWTFNIGGQYTADLSGSGSLTGRIDYSYRSSFFIDAQNSPGAFQEGYGLLAGRLTFSPPSEKWSVAVYGTNLTDEAYIVGGTPQFNALGFDEVVRGRPREFGGVFSVNF